MSGSKCDPVRHHPLQHFFEVQGVQSSESSCTPLSKEVRGKYPLLKSRFSSLIQSHRATGNQVCGIFK
jgi:hypothetical protein